MTSGFYALQNDELIHAPNFVEGPGFSLKSEDKDKYSYPVSGWTWFDSIEEAASFFGVELPQEDV